MLNDDQISTLKTVVNASLDKAEKHWENGGYELAAGNEDLILESAHKAMDWEPSKIPGHENVHDNRTTVDEFIAFVADMRSSSDHLMCAISEKNAKVSGLQRVYYETSALLPAIAMTIGFEGGNVTEYLGDGVLALFKVDADEKDKAVYASFDAAKNTIQCTRDIVNQIINKRYDLPSLDIGVGLAYSKALVTLVGLEGDKHPKAFGECVFRATKMSCGKNEVLVDEKLRAIWPKSSNGKLKFEPKKKGEVSGFLVFRC